MISQRTTQGCTDITGNTVFEIFGFGVQGLAMRRGSVFLVT